MLKVFIVFISLVTLANGMNSVVPINKLYSDSFNKCSETAISTYDDTNCLEKELELKDKELNKAYKKAMYQVQDFRKDDLKKIQREWIKYRDLKCDFYYHKESGSGGLSDVSECKLEETIQRTIELEYIF